DLIRGGPVREALGELAPARRRLRVGERAHRVPDPDHAVRRRRAERRREAPGPYCEYVRPGRLVELALEEDEPLREHRLVPERGTPGIGRDAVTGRKPRQEAGTVALEPRDDRVGSAHR